jgi:hypothetical protein
MLVRHTQPLRRNQKAGSGDAAAAWTAGEAKNDAVVSRKVRELRSSNDERYAR